MRQIAIVNLFAGVAFICYGMLCGHIDSAIRAIAFGGALLAMGFVCAALYIGGK